MNGLAVDLERNIVPPPRRRAHRRHSMNCTIDTKNQADQLELFDRRSSSRDIEDRLTSFHDEDYDSQPIRESESQPKIPFEESRKSLREDGCSIIPLKQTRGRRCRRQSLGDSGTSCIEKSQVTLSSSFKKKGNAIGTESTAESSSGIRPRPARRHSLYVVSGSHRESNYVQTWDKWINDRPGNFALSPYFPSYGTCVDPSTIGTR
jgi:hypothetical protein